MTTLTQYEAKRLDCVNRVREIQRYLRLSKYDPVTDTRWQPNQYALESMRELKGLLDEAVDYYKQ